MSLLDLQSEQGSAVGGCLLKDLSACLGNSSGSSRGRPIPAHGAPVGPDNYPIAADSCRVWWKDILCKNSEYWVSAARWAHVLLAHMKSSLLDKGSLSRCLTGGAVSPRSRFMSCKLRAGVVRSVRFRVCIGNRHGVKLDLQDHCIFQRLDCV